MKKFKVGIPAIFIGIEDVKYLPDLIIQGKSYMVEEVEERATIPYLLVVTEQGIKRKLPGKLFDPVNVEQSDE